MPFRLREILYVVLVCGLALAGILLPRDDYGASVAVGDRVRVAGVQSRPIDRASVAAVTTPDVLAAVRSLGALAVEVRTSEYLAGVDAFLGSLPIPAAAPSESVLSSRVQGTSLVGGGGISQEQFASLALCESGTDVYANPTSTGGWRTGLYGIEGSNAGSLSVAEQQAWAQRIYSQYGPSAWGCPI